MKRLVMTRREIAEEVLGYPVDAELSGGDLLYAKCPGADMHTTSYGRRDFRIMLNNAPTAFCFHGHCSDVVEDFNKRFRQRIWREEHPNSGQQSAGSSQNWNTGVSNEPRETRKRVPAVDLDAIAEFTRGVPDITNEWLRARSALESGKRKSESGNEIDSGGSEHEVDSSIGFLDALYRPGERVLIFTEQWSQGDFAAWVTPPEGGGQRSEVRETKTYRLSQTRGVKAVASALPNGGKEGVWFLVQPVSGGWAINPNGKPQFRKEGDKGPQWSRRFQNVVTSWRYFVLESDELAGELWRKVVACLPLPIAAIYTSGSRSIHALVKAEVASKAEWDAVRDGFRQLVCPLGADAGALSAVRLSRLPFCSRAGTRTRSGAYKAFDKPGYQELLYLNPNPSNKPLRLMPAIRS